MKNGHNAIMVMGDKRWHQWINNQPEQHTGDRTVDATVVGGQ